MITSMQDLIGKLEQLETKNQRLRDTDIEEILGISIADIKAITVFANAVNRWMSVGTADDLLEVSKLVQKKRMFELARTIFFNTKPKYYVYAFDPKVAPKSGATLLRKRKIRVLNFGGMYTQLPKLKLYKTRKVITSVTPSKDIYERTFFYNSYDGDFIKLHAVLVRLSKIRKINNYTTARWLILALHALMRTCYSYRLESEVLVNISEIKCKVVKVNAP